MTKLEQSRLQSQVKRLKKANLTLKKSCLNLKQETRELLIQNALVKDYVERINDKKAQRNKLNRELYDLQKEFNKIIN